MSEMVSKAYHESTVADLHRQIFALQQSVIDLRRKLLKPQLRFPIAWRLLRSEDHALGLLVDAAPEAVGRERLFIAFNERTDREMNDVYLTTRVAMVRRKLEALGFGRIEVRHRVGYYITAATATQIKIEAARALNALREIAS